MYKNDQIYDQWNDNKKDIAKNESIIKFQQFQIIFMKMGANIGYEQDGKGDDFLRPVLVYKKFNNRIFLGIPLTSKPKDDKFHFEFEYKKSKKSYAILSQIRLFDIKRAKYYDGKISKNQFEKLQKKLLELIVTPLRKKGECTKAICEDIISKKILNVKSSILVTGSNGQVAKEIKEIVECDKRFIFTSKDELDITDFKKLESFLEQNSIKTIINCAGFTNVDGAESEKEIALKVNYEGVKNLAKLSNRFGIRLIHLSTDYVFDGKNYKPYCEDDELNPVNFYGVTKLKAEQAIQELNLKNYVIVRTSWVYGKYGDNFVKTILKYANERDELNVIYDQIGTPTYAKDLAKILLQFVEKGIYGIYHFSNEGVLSWYDFAKEIVKMAKIDCKINPIESFEYPLPAIRPHFSLLNKSKIKKELNLELKYWKDSLDECLKELGIRE